LALLDRPHRPNVTGTKNSATSNTSKAERRVV
jgi:hypothetical protein